MRSVRVTTIGHFYRSVLQRSNDFCGSPVLSPTVKMQTLFQFYGDHWNSLWDTWHTLRPSASIIRRSDTKCAIVQLHSQTLSFVLRFTAARQSFFARPPIFFLPWNSVCPCSSTPVVWKSNSHSPQTSRFPLPGILSQQSYQPLPKVTLSLLSYLHGVLSWTQKLGPLLLRILNSQR